MKPSECIKKLSEKIGDSMNGREWKDCCRDWFKKDDACDCEPQTIGDKDIQHVLGMDKIERW